MLKNLGAYIEMQFRVTNHRMQLQFTILLVLARYVPEMDTTIHFHSMLV
jgi:hypothetical protein